MDPKLKSSWWSLRVAYGVLPIVAGLDKFFNWLADWEAYLSPLAVQLLPVSPEVFMRFVGVVEIVVGLVVLSRWTRVGAYVAAAWLALIALNLITTGRYFDIAARDAVLAVGAFALGQLDSLRARVGEEARAPRRVGRRAEAAA